MGARTRLNGAYLTGCLLLAGLAGALAGSWVVFVVGFSALAVIDLFAGNIRPTNRK